MTEALNRKFDLLLRSGTCSPYLLDVVTLLVAHANDTELLKKELRSAPFDNAVPPKAQRIPNASADHVGAAPQPAIVSLVPRQSEVGVSVEVEQAALSAKESVLLAAETSLRSYAADLKKINDIAIATSSKSLRELKTSTSTDMSAFRDRVVRDTVEQTREELDSLRMGWLESMDKDVERLKAEIHQMGLTTQNELRRIVEGCNVFISKGFKLLKAEPLVDVHCAMAQSALSAERVELVERQIVPRAEIDVLCERVKSVERVIAQMVNDARVPAVSCVGAALLPLAESLSNEGAAADPEDAKPLGLQLRDGGDEVEGVIITEVTPNSSTEKAKIGVGCIISHVGRTYVSRKSDFAAAVQQAGSVVKLTVYDPQTARVRIVTVER
ncbi:hypothetical protein DQ04_00571150 [Trypanosoma grayi]|uniref:hypothetical protein n=1 Tax=Trypanosoma grayi TaxID=71804 RepID=UPI0004F4BC9B|nr:hypothetical protein DQ04_00571150 [Trypanosoma grayi]KEG14220.1 hypothetical protein DQ04_00571150 [Trypanosoma grayi]